MKRVLKWFAAGFAVLGSLVVLFVLSGFLLTPNLVLETDRRVAAPPEAVYEWVSTYEGLQKWWGAASIAMGEQHFDVLHLAGPTTGSGMQVGFGSEDQIMESWTYTAAEPPDRVAMDVDFGIFISHRTLELKPDGEGTHVFWREEARVDAPHWRWMLRLFTNSAIENRQTVLGALDEAAE